MILWAIETLGNENYGTMYTCRHVTVREIEEMLKIPKSTIYHHIQRLGLVKKLDTWIPHELKEIHLTKRTNACDLHLKRNEFDPFLKRIITSDKEWIV